MSSQHKDRNYQRTGNTAQCPACGVGMDANAYRCPRCFIYFCFKCRRRVQERDEQYQCMNQQCNYYGKLLCNACVIEVPQFDKRSRQEQVEAGRKVAIVPRKLVAWAFGVVGVLGCIAGHYCGFPWWGCLLAGLVFGGVVAAFLATRTRFKQPVYKTVTETVEVGRMKSCIACRQAVEHLR